jgi:alkylhydroperoxidase family enzyme
MATVAPEAAAWLQAAGDAAHRSIDPARLEIIQRCVAAGLGTETGTGTPDTADAPEAVALAELANQFTRNVADRRPAVVAVLNERLGRRGTRDLVEAIYVFDQAARLSIGQRRLFGPGEFAEPTARIAAAGPASTIGEANAGFHHAVMRLDQMDLATTEIVRLRAGRYHDCRACCSLRLVQDGVPLVAEPLAARIPAYQDDAAFTPAQRAALRYADAHMTDPSRIGPALADELRAHYTPAQIVELSLDVSAWNYQKVLVALDLDRPASPDGLTGVVINRDGTMTRQTLLL